MVGAIAPSYANLASQKQLCERLAYLTRFSSLLAFVAGCEGAGKTTIVQQYLEQQPDTNQALITGNKHSDEQSIRQQLISQLYPSTTFDAQTSLIESLQQGQCLETVSQNILIVIDDAHFLPTSILNELWQLQLDNRAAGYPNQINVLLFALPQWSSQSHSLLKSQGDEPPIELDIAALDTSDAIAMAKYHLTLAGLSSNISSDLQTTIKGGHLSPGLIFSKLFPEQSPSNTKQKPLFILALKNRFSKLNLKVLAVSLAVILVVVINGVYQLQSKDNNLSVVSTPQKPVISNEQQNTAQIDKAQPEAKQAEPKGESRVADWPNKQELASDNQQALPKMITSASVEINSKPVSDKQIIITGEQVDKLLAQQEAPQAGLIHAHPPSSINNGKVKKVTSVEASVKLEILTWEDQEPSSEKIIETKESNAAIASVDTIKKAPQKALKKPETESQSTVKAPSKKPKPQLKASPINNELKSKSSKRYTLQLGGFSSQQQIDKFISNHQLKGSSWTYQTIRDDKPWFVVIIGDYSTLADSRAAIKTLPLSLRSLSPWGKSFASVKKEMKLANKGAR